MHRHNTNKREQPSGENKMYPYYRALLEIGDEIDFAPGAPLNKNYIINKYGVDIFKMLLETGDLVDNGTDYFLSKTGAEIAEAIHKIAEEGLHP